MTPEERAERMQATQDEAWRVFLNEWPRRVACVECGLSRHPAMPCARCGCYCDHEGMCCNGCHEREARKARRFARVVLALCVMVFVFIVTRGALR